MRGVAPQRMAWLVEVAARYHVLRPTCLPKAIVLYWLLRQRGLEAKVVIGAQKTADGIGAHAWLEYEGRILIGESGEVFAPLDGAFYQSPGVTERQQQTA